MIMQVTAHGAGDDYELWYDEILYQLARGLGRAQRVRDRSPYAKVDDLQIFHTWTWARLR